MERLPPSVSGETAAVTATVAGLAGGLLASLFGYPAVADGLWLVVTAGVLLALLAGIVRALRRGETGIDLLALLAMTGALLLHQYLAGAVIAVMYSGGRALEHYAAGRARRELAALLARNPTRARRYRGETLEEIPVEQVTPGDLLLVRPGDVLPADGVVEGATAVLDESALTGESRPAQHPGGDRVRSGTVNAGAPFDLRAVASAEQSTYAGVIRLVAAAQGEKPPFQRLADRYALLFVPASLLIAGGAWLLSGDPVRALAVLVVATPCPLILAAPVAIVSGISRAARRGILVKGGGALETLARARILLFDKTGTLTHGRARLVAIEGEAGQDHGALLQLAASLEQASQHVMAEAVVNAARSRGLGLSLPSAVEESAGAGLRGTVDGRRVTLGGYAYVAGSAPPPAWAERVLRRMDYEGAAGVFVALDDTLTGALVLADEIRTETPRALRALRRAGIRRIVMVSGDRQDVAETVAAALDVDGVLAERSPLDKVEAVSAERRRGVTLMVGDGINDAPALAAADVGVALGARGASASAEAADVVLLVDRLDRLGEALEIARRTRGIALQSVFAGMAMSFAAMGVAAWGWLTPVAGALLQEVIDLAVILNALRALGGRARGAALPATTTLRLTAEHRQLEPLVERIVQLADRLDSLETAQAQQELTELERVLSVDLLTHESEDETRLYPVIAEMIGGEDPLGSMSRTHREISHLVRRLRRLLADMHVSVECEEELREVRRVLYGLAAILRLHFAQEEEIFVALSEDTRD